MTRYGVLLATVALAVTGCNFEVASLLGNNTPVRDVTSELPSQVEPGLPTGKLRVLITNPNKVPARIKLMQFVGGDMVQDTQRNIPPSQVELVVGVDDTDRVTLAATLIGNGVEIDLPPREFRLASEFNDGESLVIPLDLIEPPVITCPPDVADLRCGEPIDPNATGVATATGAFDTAVTLNFADNAQGSDGGDCPAVIQRTWRAVDLFGNASTCVQTLAYATDTGRPEPAITCPPDLVINCDASTDPEATGFATATSGGETPTVSFSDEEAGACPAVLTRTWTATNDAGSATCVQTITRIDVTPPTLECPDDVTVECDASTDPNATGTPTVSDNCDPNPTLTHTDTVSMGETTTTITRTWTARDACGNISVCVQTITQADRTPPTINCPEDYVGKCDDATDPGNTGFATAGDACSDVILFDYHDEEYIDDNDARVIERTWRAMDESGNEATCVQMITLTQVPPEIACPPPALVYCGDNPAPVGPADCSGTPILLALPDDLNENFSYLKLAGAAQAGDAAGVARGKVYELALSSDYPLLDATENHAAWQSGIAEPLSFSAKALAEIDELRIAVGDDALSASAPSGSLNNLRDVYIRMTSQSSEWGVSLDNVTLNQTLIAKSLRLDGAGVRVWRIACADFAGDLELTGDITFTFDGKSTPFFDELKIEILVGKEVNFGGGGRVRGGGDSGSGLPEVLTVCDDGPLTYAYRDTEFLRTPQTGCGYIDREWTVIDGSGRVSEPCVQRIYRDALTLICPPDVELNCTASRDPNNTGVPEAFSFCDDGAPSDFAYDDTLVTGEGCPVVVRQWFATDACENFASCDQYFTLLDMMRPRLTCPPTAFVDCNDSIEPAVTGFPEVLDNCDLSPTVFFNDQPGRGVACPETILRIWTARDDCGNTSACEQLIIRQG